jgi:hypothetical protein
VGVFDRIFVGRSWYDTDWFREALQNKGIEACITPMKNRKQKIRYNTKLYKLRHEVENMFGKLKD